MSDFVPQSAPSPASFRAIIELWPSQAALAAEVSAGPSTVSKWWQRDSIPADWWSAVLETEVAGGAGLSAEIFTRLAARRTEFAELATEGART